MTPGLPRWIYVPAALGALFVVLPLIAVAAKVDWSRFLELISSESSVTALVLSLKTAAASTVLCVLAGVAVRDLDAALPWYERLLGKGERPMKEVCEWRLPRGGCLQLFADGQRAGRSSVTFAVSDLAAQLTSLRARDIPVGSTTATSAVKTAIVEDPDGNQIVFAEALDDRVAR